MKLIANVDRSPALNASRHVAHRGIPSFHTVNPNPIDADKFAAQHPRDDPSDGDCCTGVEDEAPVFGGCDGDEFSSG